MALIFKQKGFGEVPANILKNFGNGSSIITIVEKGPKFYRFYGQTGEIYWSFVYPPSQYCLDMTCKMLRYPNCMEITEDEYKKGSVD